MPRDIIAIDDDEQETRDSDNEFDPESFYQTEVKNDTHEDVKKFLMSTFRRCIPKKRRLAISRTYPVPDVSALRVPKADKDIASILDKDFPTKSDKELRIQAAALAPCAPLANLLSEMMKQGFCGKDELMPTSEVVKVIRDSLALIGNVLAYIAQCRRQAYHR